MPIDYSKYSSDWKEISLRIRTSRARGRCECRGECGIVHRRGNASRCQARNGLAHPDTGSKVVLTVAHLNHDITDNRDKNLAALCQRCHLNYDAKHHARNAAETRRQKKRAAGQMELQS